MRALLLTLLLPVPLAAQTANEKLATIKFLTNLQQPDGGFIAAPAGPKADGKLASSLRATSAAVRAIKYMGGKLPNEARTISFVQSCHQPDAFGFADVPNGTVDVTATSIGMMAAAELYYDKFVSGHFEVFCAGYLTEHAKTFEDRRLAVAGMEAAKIRIQGVEDWFAEIEKTANADGTFGKGDGQARDTGGVIAMALRYGEEISDKRRGAVVAVLQAGQRSDGGFGKPGEKGSDGETTYRVMRAFHLLKEKPKDVAKLKEFLAKCRNADGGYGSAPGQPSTVSGTYYAAAVGMWLSE